MGAGSFKADMKNAISSDDGTVGGAAGAAFSVVFFVPCMFFPALFYNGFGSCIRGDPGNLGL